MAHTLTSGVEGGATPVPGIVVARTPPPTALEKIDYLHLPWFQFQELLERVGEFWQAVATKSGLERLTE